MFVLVAAPFVIGLVLGFFDHHQGTWTFVGLRNFGEILSGGGRSFDDPLNFWFILGVTVLWTAAATCMLHVTIGVGSRSSCRAAVAAAARACYRMLLILPWAIPNYITALIWKGMFQGEYGAVNSLLHAAGLDGVSWFSSWATAFSANVITNTWLGFPFMMVVALGALETIPRELLRGRDGRRRERAGSGSATSPCPTCARRWARRSCSARSGRSTCSTSSTSCRRGKPGGSTDILVTDAYRWAFERGDRYGMAAALRRRSSS